MKRILGYIMSLCSAFSYGAFQGFHEANLGFLHALREYKEIQEIRRDSKQDLSGFMQVQAQAHGEYKTHNDSTVDFLHQMLTEYAGQPRPLCNLIIDYIHPGWSLCTRTKIHNNVPLHIDVFSGDIVYSCAGGLSDDARRTEYEYSTWNVHTGVMQGHDPLIEKVYSRSSPTIVGSWERFYPILASAYAANGEWAVVSDRNKGLLVWKLPHALEEAEAHGQVRCIHKPERPGQSALQRAFSSVAISPCRNYIFAGGFDGTVSILDAKNHQVAYTLHHDSDASVTGLKVIQDGNTLIAGLDDGSMVVWAGNFQHASEPIILDHKAPQQSLPLAAAVQPHEAPEQELMTDVTLPSFGNACYQDMKTCCFLGRQCKKTCVTCSKDECTRIPQCAKACATCCHDAGPCCCALCLCRWRRVAT